MFLHRPLVAAEIKPTFIGTLLENEEKILNSFLNNQNPCALLNDGVEILRFAEKYSSGNSEQKKIAVELSQLVIKHCCANTLYLLGESYYETERFVKKNTEKGINFLHAAGEKGNSEAWFKLGRMYIEQKNFKLGESCLSYAVKSSIIPEVRAEDRLCLPEDIQTKILSFYLLGDKTLGIEKNMEKYNYFYTLLYYHFYIEDENIVLGMAYLDGIYNDNYDDEEIDFPLIEKDEKKAEHYLELATTGEYGKVAYYYLGRLYANKGTRQGLEKSLVCFEKIIDSWDKDTVRCFKDFNMDENWILPRIQESVAKLVKERQHAIDELYDKIAEAEERGANPRCKYPCSM